MKLLHVYSGNLYGGVEAMLVVLARDAGACPGLEPEFALCFEGRLAQELRACGATVHILGAVRASRPASVMRARRALRALLGERRPDFVMCHSAWSYSMFGGTARRLDLPVGFWLHDAVRGRHWTERWAKLRTPDIVIYNSRYTGETVSAVFARARTALVHCPVAPPVRHKGDREAVRQELGVAPDTVVIIQVGRLERWKGHPLLLHALGFLGELPGWECWIVGGAQRAAERAYEAQLRTLAVSRGVRKRVRFLGERSDVPRVLAAADIFCQPNAQAEPFGVAIIEALYAELPVVATDMGGPTEILGGQSCGVLVPPRRPEELAKALRALIEHPSGRHAMGALGPRRARELSDPGAQLQRLHDVLTRATAERSAR
ncbi:MAG: glycosyltransferase family 4 protein [Gemmatimonadota bacterium]|nr:glycosyltransferase family 4 protein [Gemmatimonadota bacterium]MDE3128631.1 glycosyltransferase family 4 protein [Gemmatimonadota bacterium]MDE3174431.1 glycosyltransferase family 4 protein [Gemmatimonadota bacterium]MDE3216683.1 glycosyltransferase family 4 protein [Gemmatimonadota bacterium]